MHPTPATLAHQRQRLNHHRTNADSYRFFNVLTGDQLLDTVDALSPPHRERLYPPTETLSMFLAQALSADHSCQRVVNQAAVQRVTQGLTAASTHTGGYCRARQRLPMEMISTLTRDLGALLDQQVPQHWRWRKRRVRIVDGTTVTLPDTPANQTAFPQQRGQRPGLGFPICRLVGITCLSSGALLNAAVGRFRGKGGDEQSLLRSMLDTFQSGDIVLGDAFYGTYFFLAAMQDRGGDILMEQFGARRRSTDFRRGQKIGKRDHLIQLTKPPRCPSWMDEAQYDSAPDSITVREMKVAGKILLTTMTCPSTYPTPALKALYQCRWHVELDIRHIKETLGMNTLSCKSPDMAVKELWVYLLAYNLIRLMMAQSALLADIQPRTISFKHCLQIWLACREEWVRMDCETLDQLLRLIAQQRVGHRPGRVEPRAVKRRPKAFPLLMKPREQARAEVVQYGHTKKLK